MNYLYQYPTGTKPETNYAFVKTLSNGDSVYLLPNERVVGTLVGQWDNDGSLTFINDTTWLELRKYGNEEINLYDEDGNITGTKSGMATDHLDIVHYQGHKQRHMQMFPTVDTLPEYYTNNQPFILRITRTLTTDDDWPHIPWGWTVDVIAADPVRTVTARAIGVYNALGDYLYTTGSFIDDGDGNYSTSCPIGQRTAFPFTIYFKLLFGALPEGEWKLTDLDEGAMQERLFWAGDQ